MRAPAPRTAVVGALFSAGVVATMLTTATVHGPTPDPHPAVSVTVLEDGGTRSTDR